MNQFRIYALKRILAGILMAGFVLWGVTILIKYFGPATYQIADSGQQDEVTGEPDGDLPGEDIYAEGHKAAPSTAMGHTGMDALDTAPDTDVAHAFREEDQDTSHGLMHEAEAEHGDDTASLPSLPEVQSASPTAKEKSHGATSSHQVPPSSAKKDKSHGAPAESHSSHEAPVRRDLPKGVVFVEAAINPLLYELNERFWGWRPNDLIKFTDNVNNHQRGVLEVTRKTAFALAERISRTGSTEAFNIHLERAMNWLMVKADNYWFPSPETKYREALTELGVYKKQLETGRASFYTRTDNIIPLLQAFENLLGSCEENLVKTQEKDGEKVSFFKADDYFFYAQGVAGAMGKVLEAVLVDFGDTIDTRRGIEVLHHAIESCHHATEIDPWIILNSKPDSVFANHRANMAAPISHARFFIGVLIRAIST